MGIYTQPPPPFMGGGQPHAPPRLPPVITAVRVDNPPLTDGGPIAIPSSIASIAQPNPWTYTFFGAQQPFQPKKLSPGIPGQSVDLPPFLHRARSIQAAEITVIWQPDPWTYSFMGSGQPFGPRLLGPGIPGRSVDNPPFSDGGPVPIPASIVAMVQPDPWSYAPIGRAPYSPRLPNPAIPGRSVDPPPFTYGGPFALKYEGVAVNQPDWSYTAWPYVFMGARQPYAPRTLSPSITAVAVNDPPFAHPSRSAAMRAIREAWNPPPFDFQMQLYASRATPPRLKPTARGYIIY